MLKQSLTSINKTLENLIEITQNDIQDIKQAKHEMLFERNIIKEELVTQFTTLKSQIDSILVQRNQSGIDLNDMFNEEENILLDEFRNKLQEFYTIHKKFAKMALIVTNFYKNLVHKVNGSEVDIGYQMTNTSSAYSNFSLKA